MIKVQFPKSQTNSYWDGKKHDIIPQNLVCLNDSEYYYMDGFDNSFGVSMMTLLRKSGNKFNKVPLDNYDVFRSMMSEVKYGFVSTELLGKEIGLEHQLSVEELKKSLGLSVHKQL